MNRIKQSQPGSDRFFDLEGLRTGTPVTRKFVFTLLAAAAALLLLSRLPLEHYGESTPLALGFLVAVLILIIFAPLNIAADGMIVAVGGIALGFWDWSTVGSTFGSSSFLSVFGMLIVAMGCEFTPFGKRIAYTVLKRFGHKPTSMVLILGVVSACLSSFVSNVAVIIMMSSICAELLAVMGQKSGESKLGKTVMLVVPMAAIVGGMALINGSPTGNTMAIQFLSNSTGGEFTVTYTQWAAGGVSCFLLTILPISLIYVKCFRLRDSDLELPPKSYYEALLQELGPIHGSEIRWVLTVIAMVICMLSGMGTGTAAMLFALITIFPVIGTVPAEKALKKLPLHAMMAAGLMPLLAQLFSSTGLGDCIGDWIMPLVGNMGPLALMCLSALIMGILVNVFINANLAVSALIIGIISPVCVSLGYNPSLIMLPSMFLASFFFAMGSHNIMLLNNGYGYWDMKDPILPGFLVILFCALVFPVICYFLLPLFGFPIYL